MEYLGFCILLSTIIYVDYHVYVRGNANSLFFKDKNDLEKDLREIQKLEIKLRLRELQGEKDNQ